MAAEIDSRLYAIHTDHLGTPRRLTQADGQPAWQWAYTPYGDEAPTLGAKRFTNETTNPTTGATNIPPVRFNLRYPGQYFDAESGLHYNYFRSYDPRTGRYTQFDPIGLRGGLNGYAYVDNSPLNSSDPTGLIKWTGSFGGGGVIATVGASYYRYDLTSECVNGKKARVQGYALGGSAGVGLTAAGSTGGTVFEDNETTLHPEGFNGRFAIYGAGFALGRGRPGNFASESALNAMGRPKPNNGMSWSDVVLGNARTADGSNFGEVRGIDFSASFTAGSSIVTSITYMDCTCPN